MNRFVLFMLIVIFTGLEIAAAEPRTCTYSTYKWNVELRKAVDYRQVKHSYQQLSDDEIDRATGCTVCEEDQINIYVADLHPVKLCKKYANHIESLLSQLHSEGEVITKLVGYRVGMTRGDVDESGNRTQFSNHSFGIALDVNDEQNGLYGNCLEFGAQCELRKGGRWEPGFPGALTYYSPVVLELKNIGLKWGGEIQGWQKDFMHFSPSGY